MQYEQWFPLDAGITSDRKIKALISECGWEAFGWFIDILAQLRKSPGYKIEWGRPYVKISMAKEYSTTVERLSTTVERMFNDFDLLVLKDGFLSSHGMDRHAALIENGREQRRAAGIRSAESRRISKKTVNGPLTSVQRDSTARERVVNRVEEKRGEERGEPRAHAPAPEGGDAFKKLVELLRSARVHEFKKLDNVTDFEIKQLNSLFWAVGEQKIATAIEFLAKRKYSVSLDFIEKHAKGNWIEQEIPKNGLKSAEVPVYKPKKKKTQEIGDDDLRF